MTDTWYVFYSDIPKHSEHGCYQGLELFTDYKAAKERHDHFKKLIIDEARWETGQENGGDYYYEYPDGDVEWCNHLALRIGKAEWKN